VKEQDKFSGESTFAFFFFFFFFFFSEFQMVERFRAPMAASIDTAVRELRLGRKTSHWMWYIFPQAKVFGKSERALR
jgi:hypothetical protein